MAWKAHHKKACKSSAPLYASSSDEKDAFDKIGQAYDAEDWKSIKPCTLKPKP